MLHISCPELAYTLAITINNLAQAQMIQSRLERMAVQLREIKTLTEGALAKQQPPFFGALNDWALVGAGRC